MALRSMQERRTIRRYSEEPISDVQIRQLLLAAMYAPSAWGKRSWEFIVVDDAGLRKELGTATPYAGQAAAAPVDIIVMADKNSSSSWIEDSSIAAEHINLAATKMGLGSSWVQIRGMKHDTLAAEVFVRNLLDIPENYGICCMITVGYPAEEKSPHRESEFDDGKVHFNRYGSAAAA